MSSVLNKLAQIYKEKNIGSGLVGGVKSKVKAKPKSKPKSKVAKKRVMKKGGKVDIPKSLKIPTYKEYIKKEGVKPAGSYKIYVDKLKRDYCGFDEYDREVNMPYVDEEGKYINEEGKEEKGMEDVFLAPESAITQERQMAIDETKQILEEQALERQPEVANIAVNRETKIATDEESIKLFRDLLNGYVDIDEVILLLDTALERAKDQKEANEIANALGDFNSMFAEDSGSALRKRKMTKKNQNSLKKCLKIIKRHYIVKKRKSAKKKASPKKKMTIKKGKGLVGGCKMCGCCGSSLI